MFVFVTVDTHWSNHHHADMTKYGVQQTMNTDTETMKHGIFNLKSHGCKTHRNIYSTIIAIFLSKSVIILVELAWRSTILEKKCAPLPQGNLFIKGCLRLREGGHTRNLLRSGAPHYQE